MRAIVILLILSWCVTASLAQQTSASPPDAAKTVIQTGSGTSNQNGDRSSGDAGNQPSQDSVPELPGAKVLVLKPTDRLPQRYDSYYEDLSKPELPPNMRPEGASLGIAKGDGFTSELVELQWRELDNIDVYVIKPANVKKPPAILYLYSYPSTNEMYKDSKTCQFLTKDGFAAVGFVSALTGHRFHDRPQRQTFITELRESLGASTHDVQMILNYLEHRGDLDMTRVGVWGDGSGASIAIMAAAVDPRIKVLDLLDPWGDWPDWMAKSSLVPEKQRANFLQPGFLESVKNLDPLKWLPQLKTQQVRLQYIKQGITVTPATVMERMEVAAPSNVKIVDYHDEKEFFTEVASKGAGFDWIKQRLQDASLLRSQVQKEAKTSSWQSSQRQ